MRWRRRHEQSCGDEESERGPEPGDPPLAPGHGHSDPPDTCSAGSEWLTGGTCVTDGSPTRLHGEGAARPGPPAWHIP